MNESTALVVVENVPPPSRVISQRDFEVLLAAIHTCTDPGECRRAFTEFEALERWWKKTKGDETTIAHARRLQLWALRRCGELLAECTDERPYGGDRRSEEFQVASRGHLKLTPILARLELSERTARRMLSLAAIPLDTFESTIEVTPPPGFLKLAAMAPRLRVIRTTPPPPPPPSAPPPKHDKSQKAVRARLVRIRKLAADGATSDGIARAVGLSTASVRAIVKREGIDVPADRSLAYVKRPTSRRIVEGMLAQAESLTADVELINLDDLPLDQFGLWLSGFRGAAAALNHFIRKLARYSYSKGGDVWQEKPENR
jgi:hypothetical protein